MNNKTTDLTNAITALETALTDVRNNLDAAYSTCGAPCSGGPDYSAGTSIGVDSNQVHFIKKNILITKARNTIFLFVTDWIVVLVFNVQYTD